MAAVVEVDAGQAAKQNKATEEKGKTPPPHPVGAPRKQRQPTPDHPPYCWMIGEAIDELCEDGGSEEDSISAFIRARHPGVPPAHDRLLRHYIEKHVVEGFFVCTAAGRYLRNPEESTDVERPVEQSAAGLSEEACVGSPVVEARKDGARSAIPKRRAAAGLAAAQEYAPASPVAVADKKDGSQAASSLPKRRGRRRAVVGLTAAEDSVPASPVAFADREDGSQAVSSTPKGRGQRQAAARLAAAEDTLPTSPAAVADKDGDQAASSTPKRRGRLHRLGMTTATNSSGKALVPGQKDSSEVPYTTGKELALVIMGNGSATTSIMDKACTEATPTMPVDCGPQPLELALVTTTDVPVPVAMPTIDNKKDGRDAPSFDLALVAKTDDICRASTSPVSSSQACELVLVAADDGSVPVLLGVEEAPYATNKSVRQLCKAGSVPTAGKKDGGKAPSATPKGHRRQCTQAAVATDHSALAPVAGKKAGRKVSFSFASPKLAPVTAGGCSTPASVANQDGIQARKLYPVTADGIPDDPACCLLALPCLTPAAANA